MKQDEVLEANPKEIPIMADKGKDGDFLYIIADDGNFYRLTEAEIKTEAHLVEKPSAIHTEDVPVYEILEEFRKDQVIVANIPTTRSCICVALNLLYLDPKRKGNGSRSGGG